MSNKEFTITIGAEGQVELEIKGFKGKACLDAAKLFEEIIGTITEQQTTSEYYEPDEKVTINLHSRKK